MWRKIELIEKAEDEGMWSWFEGKECGGLVGERIAIEIKEERAAAGFAVDAEGQFDEVAKFDGVGFLFWEHFDGEGVRGLWQRVEEAEAEAAEARGGRPVVEADPDMDSFVAAVFEEGVEAEAAEGSGGFDGELGDGGAEFGGACDGAAGGVDGVGRDVEVEGKDARVAIGA